LHNKQLDDERVFNWG